MNFSRRQLIGVGAIALPLLTMPAQAQLGPFQQEVSAEKLSDFGFQQRMLVGQEVQAFRYYLKEQGTPYRSFGPLPQWPSIDVAAYTIDANTLDINTINFADISYQGYTHGDYGYPATDGLLRISNLSDIAPGYDLGPDPDYTPSNPSSC